MALEIHLTPYVLHIISLTIQNNSVSALFLAF